MPDDSPPGLDYWRANAPVPKYPMRLRLFVLIGGMAAAVIIGGWGGAVILVLRELPQSWEHFVLLTSSLATLACLAVAIGFWIALIEDIRTVDTRLVEDSIARFMLIGLKVGAGLSFLLVGLAFLLQTFM